MSAVCNPDYQALIATVEPGSPAALAGLEAGSVITTVNGEPLRDLIQWRWESADELVELTVRDRNGRERDVVLERDLGQDWGIEFETLVFDGIQRCANHCTFCFIDGMPKGVRPSLTIRDDDYRLSFLTGTFVTLTNLTARDERRIIEEGLSPLRVSIHAVDPVVRSRLIGSVADRGLAAAERLLAAGIELHLQIVLVPGVNDGAVLEETLAWALRREGVLSVGVVPVGYTRESPVTGGFDTPEAARAVLETIDPFAEAADEAGRGRWVFAADEFYLKTYGAAVLDHLPSAEDYGDFELFEDGIGIVRTTVDEFLAAQAAGADRRLLEALTRWHPQAILPLVLGEATMPWFGELIAASALRDRLVPLVVANEYFGGNVDVTGLLGGADVAAAVASFVNAHATSPLPTVAIPGILFNDDGLTLDGWTVGAIESETGVRLTMVSLITGRWLDDLASKVRSLPPTGSA